MEHPASTPPSTTAAGEGTIAQPRRGRGSRVPMAATLVLAALAITAAVAAGVRAMRTSGNGGATAAPVLRFEIATTPTDDPSVAVSPDGTQVAYVANRDRVPVLWLRALDTIENRALPGTEGASLPFWSPDGRTLGFFAQGKLKRVDIDGGAPLVLADASNARGGTWNRDGVILFVPGVSAPIMRVSTHGGAVEAVTQLNAGSGPSHRSPQFLPDGKRFVFSSALGTEDTNGIYLGSLDKAPPVRVLASDTGGRFAAPDKLLTIRQGVLQAYTFNLASGTVQGEPVTIAQGLTGALASGPFAASDTGVLAYRTAGTAPRRQLVWVDQHGTTLRPVGEADTDAIASPELSADEQSVVLFSQRTGENDIWIIELARSLAHRITDGPPADAHPLWDPDGQHVVFSSQRFGSGGIARQAVDGGRPEPLFINGEKGQALSWTRDRRYLLLRRDTLDTRADLLAVDMIGDPREIVVAQSQADESEGQFSPDGKWVALASNESGRAEVFIQSFPGAKGRTQVSTGGGTQIRWSPDGTRIFYIAPDGKMMAVPIDLSGPSPRAKLPVSLFRRISPPASISSATSRSTPWPATAASCSTSPSNPRAPRSSCPSTGRSRSRSSGLTRERAGEDHVKTSDSIVQILAPASKVWRALTVPDLVKQWQYGSDLLTTWEPGTPIVFRNEWNGQVFEQKGTVLEFIPGSRLKYSLFVPRPDLQDIPEHHFFMTYELTESDGLTSVLFRQEDPRPAPPTASSGGDGGPDVLSYLKELVEVKMP